MIDNAGEHRSRRNYIVLQDNFDRVIDYLRISVTDRCNLRCIYCMPEKGVNPFEFKQILSYEEIVQVVTVAATLGVKKIRITGGEPLTRRNLPYLIFSLKAIKGIEDISLTTNGVFLERCSRDLVCSGLDRVNISVDSLIPGRYKEITGGETFIRL